MILISITHTAFVPFAPKYQNMKRDSRLSIYHLIVEQDVVSRQSQYFNYN